MRGVELIDFNPITNEEKVIATFELKDGKVVAEGDHDVLKGYESLVMGGKVYKMTYGEEFLRALIAKHMQSTRRTTRIMR